MGISDTNDTNWLTESQRTGEFFTGRSQIRPSMKFGHTSQKEILDHAGRIVLNMIVTVQESSQFSVCAVTQN